MYTVTLANENFEEISNEVNAVCTVVLFLEDHGASDGCREVFGGRTLAFYSIILLY